VNRYQVTPSEKLIIVTDVLPALLQGNYQPTASDGTCQVALYIEAGQVSQIRQLFNETDLSVPPGWQILKLPNQWILVPAFVDCHVHLALDAITGFKGLTGPVADEIIERRLREVAEGGIMALRDGSDRFNTGLQARYLSRKLSVNTIRPAVIATGRAIFRKGFYGTNLGGEGVTSFHEVENRLLQLRKEGADQVKVVLSGLLNFSYAESTDPPHFSLEEMKAIVARAGEYGLPVMVHANSDQAVRLAVQAGVHTVEHGFFLSAETLQLMAEKDVAWVPTVVPVAAALDLYQGSSREEKAIKKIIEKQLKMISLARELGVTMGLGTDAGAPGVDWKIGYRQEMKLFARAGLSAADILTIASENGAKVLGLNKKMGKIASGKKPCWLGLEKNILSSMENFKGPAGIISFR
jgi:imidazolonepropionase-like amidohydrolase